jgi:hypothetical protein
MGLGVFSISDGKDEYDFSGSFCCSVGVGGYGENKSWTEKRVLRTYTEAAEA